MRYVVKKGDNLWDIAAVHTGKESGWKDIYQRNKGVIGDDPDLIKPGQVIDVPFNLKGFVKNLIQLKVK